MPELIAKVYGSMNKADIAALAAEVSRGAALKDQVCIDILEDAAEELFVLADTCLRRLALAETDVVVSGGAISHIPLLFQAFDAKMRRNYTRVHLSKFSGEPAMGAVHLAMRKSRIC